MLLATIAATGSQECHGCRQAFPPASLYCADKLKLQLSNSSNRGKGCSHGFCSSCLRTYVRGAVRARTYPVPCPMGASACGHVFDHGMLAELLRYDTYTLEQLRQLEAEASIDPGLRIYCPHVTCSKPMSRLQGGRLLPRDQPATCPACRRDFCPHCMVSGWHQGYTCAQFQALPCNQRSAEEKVLELAQVQGWKHCPGCGIIVERLSGCHHMQCRCGTRFCYRCGKSGGCGCVA